MKARILIIDDDPIAVKILERLIISKGYDCSSASSGINGLNTANAYDPDIILLDINLPDISGIELIEKLKSLNDEIPIIMISGSGETKDIVAAMKSGASDYVQKPFDNSVLFEKISKLLEMRKVESTTKELLVGDKQGLIIGNSIQMKRLVREISKIANSNAPVLILGESGTGKSLVAKLIHDHSNRHDMPFVTINCAAIPSNLLESELFGHVKGAFTGAVSDKQGKFEIANKGSIFLDEIGELTLDLQVKLLRVLQGKEFERVGSVKTLRVDVRVIAATNKNLENAIQENSFREDLFYRLNVLPIVIPPLRERKEDIRPLIEYFFTKYTQSSDKRFESIPDNIVEHLIDYGWPGNIRELQNIIERAVVLGKEPHLKMSDFNLQKSFARKGDKITDSISSIKDLKYHTLIKALEANAGNISKTAKALGLSRDTVYRRLKKHNITLK